MLVALLGTVSASGKTIYIQPGAWSNDNAIISVNVWGDGSNTWVESLTEVETGIFKASFNDAKTTMAVVRGTEANKWKSEGAWNQTGDITITDGKLYKLYDWDNSMDGIYVGHGVVEEDYTEPAPAAGYTVDFNTAINTSDHAFQVASNWRHIVDTYESYGGTTSYASYSYSETAGMEGTGALSCSTDQEANSIYDLLVTPVVKGTVTIAAKTTYSFYTGKLEFYKITDNGDGTYARGEKIDVDVSALNSSDWTTVTIPVDEAGERIGIRSSRVWLDNFTATEATIIPEPKMTIASAVPTATTGTIYWEQQANGKVLVSYTVTVTNTGEVALTQGDEGFSVSIINRKTGDVYGTVAVPQNLAVGETSDEFVVSAEVEKSLWPNSYTYINMDLKENIFGSTVQRAQSHYTAYEPKFVFRAAESTSTSSITAAEAWGTITESTTKAFEIANTGTAPLTIKSITLPDGFTSDNAPAAEFTLAKGETQALNITQDATATGTFAGTLAIVYLDKDAAEQTYSLAFSTTVIGANTWTADFNGDGTKSSITYPAGSIAEAGINSDYSYSSGKYNVYPVGRAQSSYASENNKFITPKLHATAGAQLAYDVKGAYGASYYAKVYVSTDRKTWGEPVAYFTYGETEGAEAIGSSNWVSKTITFDTEGDYYVAFALYGTFAIDNLVGLEKADVAHDLFIKEVTWPDASIKTGTSQSSRPTVKVIPLTDEAADAYTVKYVCGENVLATVDSKALTASASTTTNFEFTWTPNVESTTVYPATKVVFEFTDGTKFETETFDLTVTNEPIFHFVKTLPSSKWNEPTDYTTPITFGKTNTADKQSFYVYNWGSAPLTVKGIAVPAGFTATPAEQFAVAAFDENDLSVAAQAVEITFSATEAGTYSGDMVITYVDGTGADATFTIAVSGTKLDPTKWYANFNDQQWPAGSIYQDNVSANNIGTYSAPDYAITSSNDTKNIFVTPKLTATAGEKLLFDAKLYSSYWSEGKVVVYAAATREEVLNAEEGTTRTQLFSVSGQDAEGAMTTDYQTFEVPALAGDFFYGFEISGRPYVDELYGLTVANVEHDWTIASSNIPTEAMQNVASTATVNILNLGLADEAADSYTVTAYVNGEAVATGEAVTVPMNHKLSDTGTQLSVSFIYPKAGTFSFYVEVKAGEYSVATDPVNVVFAEEVATAEGIQVGTQSGTGRDYGFVDWYNNDGSNTKYTDILYPASKISAAGIKAGDKIAAISFKASNSSKTFKAVVTSWVGMSTGDITYGSPDKAAMDEVSVYNGSVEFPANVESVINLATPIVWDGTSDIRVYTEAVGQGSQQWMTANYAYDNDITMSYNGTTKAAPLAYFTLLAEPATLAGTVKNTDNEGVAGATITLKADNGVEYSGTTAADGSYSFNVIQAGLDFTATVTAEGYLTHQFAYTVDGNPLNETLYKKFGLVGTLPGFDWDNDKVMIQSAEDPSIFTLEINDVEVEAGTYAFKLRADGKWGFYQLPAGSGDYTDPNNGYDVVDGNYSWNFNTSGTYNFLFTFDWNSHKLTFERPFTLSENNTADIADLNWVDVTVEREFKAGWNAVVLPFDLSAAEVTEAFGENSELTVFDGDEGTDNVTVKFKKIAGEYKYITAGYPYMLWLENPVSGLKFTKNISSTLTTATGTTFDFVGVYTKTTNNDGDYIVQGGEFRKASTANFVRPFRAYLKLKEGQSARSLNFVVTDGEGETTGIDAAKINGLEIEGVYNLNGQKVTNLNRKGIYIINGKKVMVK